MVLSTHFRAVLLTSLLCLVLAVALVLSNTPWLALHQTLATGITYDLVLIAPFIYFLLIRQSPIPTTTVVPFFGLMLLLATYMLPVHQQQHLQMIKHFVLPVVELVVLGVVVYKIRKVSKRYKQNVATSYDFFTALKEALTILFPPRASEIIAVEFGVIYYGFIAWKKRPLKSNEFSYHRKSGTVLLLGVFVFMLIVETFILHILLEQWSLVAAWILTGLGIYSLLQLIGFARSLSKRPTVICPDELRLHYGILSETTIALAEIAAVQTLPQTHKITYNDEARSLSPLGEMEKPNVMIRLRTQGELVTLYGFRRSYRTLYLHLDTPQEFTNQINHRISSLPSDNIIPPFHFFT
ncbi:hypothetical protein [Microscilla marina]|uniref:Membrane protein, putative n=1 Tax=Microscilla marina ATCC 23134 TaxID=313606 RepID=A1ZM28_MICM2|nr:hypothetical protein [Microscilla marina]EAY28560.1 membrane protein, putative [Microscilla marina ATCC 23134]